MKSPQEWSHWFQCLDDHNFPVTNIVDDAIEIRLGKKPVSFGSIEFLEEWKEMGRVISRCKKLKRIIIPNAKLNMTVLIVIFQSEGPYKFPLECLDFELASFMNAGFRALFPFLKTRKTLKKLNLAGNHLDDEVSGMLAEVLDRTCVEELNISRNSFSARGINRIISSKNSHHLIALDIFNSYSIQERFELAEILGKFLGRGDISLKQLTFGRDRTDSAYIVDIDSDIMVIQSLKTNTTVENLVFPHLPWFANTRCYPIRGLFDQLYDAVTSLVCNTSSFEELCQSNHTLQKVSTISKGPNSRETKGAKEALEMNARSGFSPNKTLRYKLKSIYFRGAFCVQPFFDMKIVWVPHLLELISLPDDDYDDDGATRSAQNEGKINRGGNLNGVYHLIRFGNLPQLFAFASPRKKFLTEMTRRFTEAIISWIRNNGINHFKPRRNIQS